jgi:hypothetical protein
MTKRDAESEFGILVNEAFAFLVDGEGFVGPERQEGGCFYYSPALSVEVRLDRREHVVITLLGGMVEDRHLRAELSCLYAEASLGPVQHIRRAARSNHSLQRSITSQAEALRSVLPKVTGPDKVRLLKACHAR